MCRSAHLEHGLLLYISGKYEDAWQELSVYREGSERLPCCERELAELGILIEKARLLSVAVHW